jgi:DNA gyrase subunit A
MFLPLEMGEAITAAVTVPDFEEVEFVTMVTRHARIKRVRVSEFQSVRPSGLIAINLEEGDQLNWVKLTHGDDDLLLVTAGGRSIRFNETQVRAMGRGATGVNAIRLQNGDVVSGFDVLSDPDLDILVVTQRGYGKVTPQSEYPRRSRFGLGVRTLAYNDKTGPVIDARAVKTSDHVTIVTVNGKTLRTPIDNISRMGRNTQGVLLLRLDKGDLVASIALHDEARRLEREAVLADERRALEARSAEERAQREAQRAARLAELAALEAAEDAEDFEEEDITDGEDRLQDDYFGDSGEDLEE